MSRSRKFTLRSFNLKPEKGNYEISGERQEPNAITSGYREIELILSIETARRMACFLLRGTRKLSYVET